MSNGPMDNGEELRNDIKAAWKEFAAGADKHPSDEDLIRYHRAELDGKDQTRIESHLSVCGSCLARLVDGNEFLSAVAQSGRTPVDAKLHRDFESFLARLPDEGKTSIKAAIPKRSGFWMDPRALLPIAAALVAALALTTIWAFSLRQENRQLAISLEEGSRGLQEQARRLQDELSNARNRYESELAQLRLPEVNVPIRNIYPRDDRSRSVSPNETNRIRVPRGTTTFILILSDYERGHEDYSIDIIDQAGRSVWKTEALKPVDSGELSVKLNRTLVDQGMMILRLLGRQKGRFVNAGEYIVQVEYL